MPGGELAVAEGDAVVLSINRLLGRSDHAFATQDWHPAGHSSSASAHPGHRPHDTIADGFYGQQVLWPDHALQGTPNAALHRDLEMAKLEVIIRKGFHPAIDSYSFHISKRDRRTATGLDGCCAGRGFRRLLLAGPATDFCVAWSAEDAVRLGYEVVMIEDACRGIGIPPESASRRPEDAPRWSRRANDCSRLACASSPAASSLHDDVAGHRRRRLHRSPYLCEALLTRGDTVRVLDDLSTGKGKTRRRTSI